MRPSQLTFTFIFMVNVVCPLKLILRVFGLWLKHKYLKKFIGNENMQRSYRKTVDL